MTGSSCRQSVHGLLCFLLAGLISCAIVLTGCGGTKKAVHGEKVFRYGTMAYGVAMYNAGMNPHKSYNGWSAIRYGVGETLFRFDDKMQPVPWLATGYDRPDDYTVRIRIRDGVTFSNGRPCDAEAVAACLRHLVKVHERAKGNLRLTSVTARGNIVTLHSSQKTASLIHQLCDPYGCIVDVSQDLKDDTKVVGTGPFITESLTPTEIHLRKNPHYWGGQVKTDKVIVKSITDGEMLTMALQNGEVDAVQGMPYSSITLFEAAKDKFKILSVPTSRVFQAAMNFRTPALQDGRIRAAICMALNKQQFVRALLNENGYAAIGTFPANLPYGGSKVHDDGYNPDKARALLAEAGYKDTDGDGYVDKDGKNLELRWLTYTSRQELPLLATAMQGYLKKAGIRLNVNATDNSGDFLKKGDWDIYSKAIVTAPTGDPQYYIANHFTAQSAHNDGRYRNPRVDALVQRFSGEFDPERRGQLAIAIVQQVLDDHAFLYAGHLRMNLVMRNGVQGFVPHPCDYYEVTKDLDVPGEGR